MNLREARIDLTAVRANLARLPTDYCVDLSGDAYGHGFTALAEAALTMGSREFRVSNPSEEATLRELAAARDIRISVEGPFRHAAALYGLANDAGLQPVMRLCASVISVKRLRAGDPVSYGYTWRAPIDTTLALVSIGYADGVSRRASNRATASLRGARPIVGRIAMDVLSLDLGDDAVSVGDEAVLFGHATGSTEAWAALLGVPPLSVTAGVGRRVARVVAGGGA